MKTITEVINDTLRELHAMKESNNDSSFCFPRYADGILRISEQELRICLIKNLYQAHYKRISVETPTKYAYSFKSGVKCKKKEDIQQNNEDCKYLSARLDLTLLKEDNASFDTIFELKAHSGTTANALYQDFVKLTTEEADKRFFIMIINGNQEGHRGKDGAIASIGKKLISCFMEKSTETKINCIFYDIDTNEDITKKIEDYINKNDKK